MKNRLLFQKTILKIMRISLYQVLMAIVFTTIAQAHKTIAQEILERKVSVQLYNQNIESILHTIEKASEVQFMYNHQIFDGKQKISFNAENEKLNKVLDRLLSPLKIDYELAGNRIILKRGLKSIASISTIENLSTELIQAEQLVKGKITDEKGEGIPGANVSIKGTQKGTSSDALGNYTISVPDEKTVLIFSSVGFEKKEIVVGKRINIDVTLANDVKSLEEVVVVGYGTAKKATLTGSVSTVNAATFKDRGPVSSPLAALQGQVAGVTVTRSSAQAGREGWNFQIRGASSANATEPLVIVDGVPVPNVSALNSFNPNDIENISFLKDGAAAIYGSRAAGGVVLITTKRGKSGKMTIEYNASTSFKKVGLLPKLIDINGWGPMMKEARTADGFAPTDIWYNYGNVSMLALAAGKQWLTKAEYDALSPNGASLFSDVKDFTFFNGTEQDMLWGNARSSEHQLSISGRTEKAGYRISLGYLDDGSLLKVGNNSAKRYNFRMAHDYQFTSKLRMETNISFEKQDITQPTYLGDIVNNGNQPGKPLSGLGLTGKPYIWGSGLGNASVNQIASLGGDNDEYNNRLNTNLNLTYNFSPSFKAVGFAGYYLFNTDIRTLGNAIPWYNYAGDILLSTLPTRSFYQRSTRQEANYNLNGYLEYDKQIGDKHNIKGVVGAQFERFEKNIYIAKTFDVLANVPPSLSLSTGDGTSKTVQETQFHTALAGYFGRLNYNYADKYFVEANARYDGSSKFRAQDRWKLFYGISGGWRLSEETFMKDLGIFDELKLRGSYGIMGNQSGIDNYDYIQFLNLAYSTSSTDANYPIIGTSPVVRVAPTGTLVAYDRTWERLESKNIGLDFTLLNRKLSGTFEYFWKRNNNMLLSRTYSAVIGASAPKGNNGDLSVWGWDFSLNWRDKIGDFSYRIGGNISDNQNKLVNFGGQNIISSANRGFNSAVEGYPIDSYFGLVYDGRIQTAEQLANYRKYITGNNIGMPAGAETAQANNKLALGDNMYKDVNGDGKITFPEDAVFLGTDRPRLSYSFNGGIEYKGFDVNFIFQGVGKRTIVRDGNWRIPAAVIFQAQNAAFQDQWWTPTRTDATLPRISSTGTINNYNYFPSNWVAEDGSYLRLKNIVIGYTIPKSITQKAKIERLRVYFSGNDLFEFSKIKDGWDPEAPRTVSNAGDSDNLNVSTTSQRYPFYRYFTFGVNLTF
ncbi:MULTISPECIES: TonB-dependent receptor [unclassified Arcicella]|uniref:TonB-dependent receptor n=1 Tax=unclassified Arcicella TaxID=2644986 RepID=UPI00285B2245|nr:MULTISPECIES: TonB-dependent receptor [unclassified Arcicella]MDR6562453.1 TonB-linked SusC/RagA family outer membrane protein [Arcicella sp. BE51]MDR6812347.1 TonB-linked SusC/RagA family outer membrane protein [Arcicella sp. BE140]MDR6823517.1 TonB-linked SusC/RagA family outer membrane protein [Arcicella sp. BE139]